MDFTTVWDRASDSSIDNWLAAKLEVEREFFCSVKNTLETSIKREEFREIILVKLRELSEKLPPLYEHYNIKDNYWYCVVPYDNWVIGITFYGRNVYIEVSSRQISLSEEICNCFKDIVPPPEPPEIDHVDFDFYMLGQDGRTNKIHRSLLAPNWSDIARNYQAETRTQFENLVNLDPVSIGDGGKLILLHGEPGLGKSYAIRSLMKSVTEWAQPSYLMDPEKFFASPPYMFDIILSKSGQYGDDDDKWRLIIAEDSDEFIQVDAKERSGQGLSRLLNLADGILGQGMKVLFLLTTNEPLKNLHPAVIRPGRCIANIEFKPFNAKEASDWFGSKEEVPTSFDPFKSKYSLAELFDAKKAQQQIKLEKELVATGQYL